MWQVAQQAPEGLGPLERGGRAGAPGWNFWVKSRRTLSTFFAQRTAAADFLATLHIRPTAACTSQETATREHTSNIEQAYRGPEIELARGDDDEHIQSAKNSRDEN